MSDHADHRYTLIPLTLALVMAVHMCGVLRPAYAQTRRTTPQLALARICASEAGLGITDDCAAIADVLRSRSSVGRVTVGIACAYSSRTCDSSRRDPRRWLAHLRPDGRRPVGWPRRVRWARQRAAWLELYEHAGAILRGEVTSACSRPPDHWGMRSGIDWRRATEAGWHIVECGSTRNAFWAIEATDPGVG